LAKIKGGVQLMAGKRGRPRTPTSKLKLSGTLRSDRHARNEPKPTGEPYQIAKLDGLALELWKKIVPELVRMKVATAIDSAMLYALCRWWQVYRKLDEDEEMESYKRICAMAAAMKQVNAIGSRFGLTPVDRASLDINDSNEEASPIAALLAGRQAKDPPRGR
jgi:P27 family predicted phage terminase small subunit